MSRRRYITSLISVDKRIRQLSDPAALLYTWMIPHAEEDATIVADFDELLAIVVPNRPKWDSAKVERCCREIAGLSLFVEHEERFYFPPVPFYRIQSNIHVSKRRTWHPSEEAQQNTENSEKQRVTAENSASPSPSPSPTKTIVASDESTVFAYWKQAMGKNGRTILDGPRKTAIRRALKVLTVDECQRAIDGCRNTPHNMGDNDRGERYNDVNLIFRDASHWERFMEHAGYRVGELPPDAAARKTRIDKALRQLLAGDSDVARAMCNPDEWPEVERLHAEARA